MKQMLLFKDTDVNLPSYYATNLENKASTKFSSQEQQQQNVLKLSQNQIKGSAKCENKGFNLIKKSSVLNDNFQKIDENFTSIESDTYNEKNKVSSNLLHQSLNSIIERLYNDELIETMRGDKNTEQFIKMRVQEIIEESLNFEYQQEIKRQNQLQEQLKSEFIQSNSENKHTIEALQKQLKTKDYSMKQAQKQKDINEQKLVVANSRISQLTDSLECERRNSEELKVKVEEMAEEINQAEVNAKETMLELQKLRESSSKTEIQSKRNEQDFEKQIKELKIQQEKNSKIIAEYQQLHQEQRISISTASQRNEQLYSNLRELETQSSQSKEVLENNIKSLELQLMQDKEKYKTNIQKLSQKEQEKTSKFKSKIAEYKQRIQELENQFSTKQLECTENQSQFERIQQQLRQKMNQQYSEFKEIRQKQLSSQESMIEGKDKKIRELMNDLEQQKKQFFKQMNEKQEILSKQAHQQAQQEQRCDDLVKVIENYEFQLKELEQTLETQKELNEQIINDQHKSNDEKISLSAKLKFQIETSNDFKQTIQQKEKEVLDLKKIMLLKNEEIKQLKKQAAELDQQVKDCKLYIERTKKNNQQYSLQKQEEMEKMENKCNSQINDLQQSRNKYIQLTESQQKKIEEISKQKSSLEQIATSLKQELERIQYERQITEDNLIKSQQQQESLEQKVNQQNEELQRMDKSKIQQRQQWLKKQQELKILKEKIIKQLNYSFSQLRYQKTELITSFISQLQLVQSKIPIEFQQISSYLSSNIFKIKQENQQLIQQQLNEEKTKQLNLVSELQLKSEEFHNQKSTITNQLSQFMTEKEYLIQELSRLKTICETTEEQNQQLVEQNLERVKSMEKEIENLQNANSQLNQSLQESAFSLNSLQDQLYNEKQIAAQQQQEFNSSIQKLQEAFTKQQQQIKIEYEKQITNLIQSLELSESNEQKLHSLISDHNHKVLNLKQSYESKLDYFQKLVEQLKEEQQLQQLTEHKTLDELYKLHDIASFNNNQSYANLNNTNTCRSSHKSFKRDFSNKNLLKGNQAEFSAQSRQYSLEKSNQFKFIF